MKDDETDAAPKRRLPMGILVPVVTLLAGLGLGYVGATFLGPSRAEAAESTEGEGEAAAAEEGGGEAAAEGEEGKTLDKPKASGAASVVTSLGTFTVNLRGSGGGRVLRVEVQVEGKGSESATVVARTPQIRDSIITAVSDYTWSELEGTDGKTRLRDELLARVNGAAAPAAIDRIYFTQFVVQ